MILSSGRREEDDNCNCECLLVKSVVRSHGIAHWERWSRKRSFQDS